MTKNQFKKGLQSEMNAQAVSFRNPIVSVSDNETLHTVIKFTYPIDEGTIVWLNKRFTHGVTISEDGYSASVNHPNEAPKTKAPELKSEEFKVPARKIIVLENDDWFWKGFEPFFKSISPNFEVFRPNVKEEFYFLRTALWLSMTLSQPDVTDVAVQSAFEGGSGIRNEEDDIHNKRQIEVIMPIIREVLRYREDRFSPLTFHVVYNGEDFIKDMKDGDLGKDTWGDFELLMRQQENITVKIYDHETYQLKEEYKAPYNF